MKRVPISYNLYSFYSVEFVCQQLYTLVFLKTSIYLLLLHLLFILFDLITMNILLDFFAMRKILYFVC